MGVAPCWSEGLRTRFDVAALSAAPQGGDVTWLAPYWEPLIVPWGNYVIDLLPFPGTQLSTDDFDGVLYNATNLALKGVASIAAYGYLTEAYTGNASEAAALYATAASYAATMVQYAWHVNGSNANQSHFMIGYAGSQGDGGDPASWAMLYNALWLRLLGFDNLLPQQSTYLEATAAWYASQQMHTCECPAVLLNRRCCCLVIVFPLAHAVQSAYLSTPARPSPRTTG